MIAKGNTHDNGARLARYITNGKDGESSELWELRGFALRDIVDAFRSVHVMAAKGQCLQPFFHVQVRNPEGETLTRVQWNSAIDKIETMMGLVDQPRAIAAHADLKTGHEHIHIAWSRIDPETLNARPLPFFKLRLKKASRELETLFGLTPVPNKRRDGIAYAPKQSEEQQSRRLGVGIHNVREAIKTCFENSACGRSFHSALAVQGLLLAKGERRDFLVVDRAGGMHALGKRILGVSAAEIRNRLADLRPEYLPSLDEARDLIAAAKRVSLDNKVDDFYDHADDAPKPVNEVKRTRLGTAPRKACAVGNEQRRDRVTKQLAMTPSCVSLDHPAAEPRASGASQESETTLIEQLRNETPEPACDTAQDAEVLYCITGLEPVTGTLPQLTQFPPPHKTAGHAARLRDQFRALIKQLTAKVLEPRPTSRKRRREEIGGGFRKAASGLLRRIARVPPLHFLDPMWEPFTWPCLWEYNCPASSDMHNDCSVPSPPEDLSLRL